MSGMGAGTNGTPSEANEGKKKRRKKVEEYDREDPFVDDTELAWQEQAAASKDGFFVYSGPLVQEGEKVQVERFVSSQTLIVCPFVGFVANLCFQCRWNHQAWSWPWPRNRPWPSIDFTSSCSHRCSLERSHFPRYRPSSPWTGVTRRYLASCPRLQEGRVRRKAW